jgi:hypothetical protein
MRGEKVKAGWVNESDFEKEPITAVSTCVFTLGLNVAQCG